jgi:hypothetical protein
MPLLKKILRGALLLPIALLLLFEEWGWEPLAAAFAALARLPLWAALEAHIKGLRPALALALFALPLLALLPLKLLALYWFQHGHITWGLGLVLGSKLLGTAITARLFQLTQPALMQLPWFARLYTPWLRWKNQLLQQVRQSALWRTSRWLGARLRRRLKSWWAGLGGQR